MERKISIRISPLFFALFAWLLIYENKRLAAGCLAASLIHECGHLLMMLWRHSPPRGIVVGMFGMRIERNEELTLSFWDDLCIAAGGPLINLVCCGIFLCTDRSAAIIHLIIAVLNLLPVESLDGGQILLNILYLKLPRDRAEYMLLCFSLLTVFPLGVAGFFVLLRSGGNISLLAVDLYLILLLIFKRKR